jgi:hypothetical protein
MTVHIDIEPEVREQLAARARSRGESLERFIQQLLETEAAAGNSAPVLMCGPEKAQAFEDWARSFPPDLPALTLEDVSREKIYSRE